MKSLALYPQAPRFDIEDEAGTDINKACRRCKLHEGVKSPCMSPEGEPGGLLVVNDSPGRDEDSRGRPLVGANGTYLRRVLARTWSGPLALDNGVKCAPGSRSVGERELSACRTYLAQVIREVQPQRIIALGTPATHSLLGRGISPQQTRRGFAWLCSIEGLDPIPVFTVLHPLIASRNRFLRNHFEDDVAWACSVDITAPNWSRPRAHLVVTGDDARSARQAFTQAPWAAWDVETAGLMFDPSFRILSVAVCGKDQHAVYVWTAEALADVDARGELLTWLASAKLKVGQNEKYDRMSVLDAFGVLTSGCYGDTRLWRKLLEPEANGALSAMADLLGLGGHKGEAETAIEDAMARIRVVLAQERKDAKSRNLSFDFITPMALAPDLLLEKVIRDDPSEKGKYVFGLIPKPVLHRYNARDAYVTSLLGSKLEAELEAQPDLHRTWKVLVGPAAEALTEVEAWGVPTSRDALEAFDTHLGSQLDELAAKLALYSTTINWDSPLQVGDLLYKTLGLPVLETTATGQASTSEATLDQLRKHHSLPGLILDHRGLAKMRGSFAHGMLAHIRSDGRIHPNLKLDGARSGRLSCEGPNLQQIPRPDSVEGRMARDVFRASPGHKLLSLDYSQLELRIAAAMSRDPEMLKIFADGVDYHQRTAELISKTAWGMDPSQVTKKERSQAKIINFAMLYGMGDSTLATKMGVSVRDATRTREAILGHFKRLAKWSDELLIEARKTGEIWTEWAGHRSRRRPMWRIADSDEQTRRTAENGSLNTPVQGTASDYGLASLTATVQWIRDNMVPAKLVLPVHDALLLEVRNDAVDEVAHEVKKIMLSWPSRCVLDVDVEIGPAWGSLTKYEVVS